MKLRTALIISLFLAFAARSQAQILIDLRTTGGTVPGTSITYTVTDTGTARAIFPPNTSDAGVWRWNDPFDEFVTTGGPQILTVNFSAPTPINTFVLGVNSISFSTALLSVSGGTATTADFNLSDGLQALTGPTGVATYNGTTGTFAATSNDRSLMIGSTSTNTLTSFTLAANNGEGYTLFYGVVTPAATAIPEPSSMVLWGVGGLGLVARSLRRRGFVLRA